MKAVVAAINQEKALVGAFSVITNLRMEFFEALPPSPAADGGHHGEEADVLGGRGEAAHHHQDMLHLPGRQLGVQAAGHSTPAVWQVTYSDLYSEL